jgi:histone H3/H4
MAKAKKNGKAKAAKKSAAREVLVVGTKVKDVVRAAGLQSSGELIDAVSGKVHEILSAAIDRANENGRKTVRSHDL